MLTNLAVRLRVMLGVAVLSCGSPGVLADDPPAAEKSLADGAARARACVLKLECLGRDGQTGTAVFSAVAIDDDGNLITVGLREPGDRKLCVRDSSGKRHEARWIAADERSGLTLLKIRPGAVHPIPLSHELPEVGSWVIVVGNPFGLDHSVSFGNVSGLNRSVKLAEGTGHGLIQFTAPIHPGDSGGLLADRSGQMLGIVCTALVNPEASDAGERPVAGIGFAVPAREVRRVVQLLRDGRKIESGYLGVTVEDTDEGLVRVTSVIAGSPAEAAGIRVDDRIASLNDVEVKNSNDLAAQLDRVAPGTEVTLRIERGDEKLAVPVTLGQRPASAPAFAWPRRNRPAPVWPFDSRRFREQPGADAPRVDQWFLPEPHAVLLGVETQPVTEALAKSLGLSSTDGALISDVIPDSPAAKAGLRPAELIVGIDDQPVKSPEHLRELVTRAGPGKKVRLSIRREGKEAAVELALAEPAALRPWDEWQPGVWFDRSGNRLRALEERIKSLEKRVEELEKRLERSADEEKRDEQ